MADIFISYSREDRSRVEPIAKALEGLGWSVWWDRNIPPGKTFDQVIQEAIEAAKCVVVIWSKSSIKSDWVKEEANIGKQRNIIVPAKIDPIEPPLGFGRIQAADLADWDHEISHAGFNTFQGAIAAILALDTEPGKNDRAAESPESILEQQSGSSPESETIHADHKPRTAVKKESPLTYQKPPRKKWVIFGVGAAVLILFLSFGVWRMILEPENSGTENIVEDHHSQKMPQPPENVNGERLTLDMLRELLRKLDSNEEKLKIQEEKIARLEKQLALLEQNPALKPVRISWDPIDGAQGYQIYYGSASGVYEMIINVGDVLEYTFDNLEPGIYYYAVTAYNEYGESGFSQERALDLTQ